MDINVIKNLIRTGRVSSINLKNNTCRVIFPDKNNSSSGELYLLNRGSKENKDYWVPDIDEQVLCLFLPNSSKGLNSGWVLGSYFSETDAPQETSADVREIKFKDGSYVRHDRSTGNLTVSATGNITIQASGAVTINGAIVNIN